ncbi:MULTISPECIES: signal peptidase I [unclassified Rhizobium]|uniref:signal peptidase I n=1 Tax=unclassified Rhizobium TaxID=2613769 RepID=UPI0009DEDE26|nr:MULTISPECIES: signal peptidase I [unclassified Rhizobium]RKD52065.1 signal peptidase I [Rhizobium sp. WW_1]
MSLSSRPEDNRDKGVGKPRSQGPCIWELSKTTAQALIIALIIRTLLFQPFNIPSGSLIPTLFVGDYVIVSKFSYGWSRFSLPFLSDLLPAGRLWSAAPNRGDIVVFRLPSDHSTNLIKRVIGLPGDHIQMRRGRLFINGAMAPREADGTFSVNSIPGSRGFAAPRYIETLPNGIRHAVIEVDGDTGAYDNTPEFIVPADQYFMMGDNRDNSEDSRIIGPIPFENLVGKAQIIFFSIGSNPSDTTASVLKIWEWPLKLRPQRLFNFIS